MKLDTLKTGQIRSNVTFGAEGTPYLDGSNLEDVSNGLHEIQGCFAVDVTNAIQYNDPKAWDLVLSNAFIVTVQ